jgi:PKD repeat protein
MMSKSRGARERPRRRALPGAMVVVGVSLPLALGTVAPRDAGARAVALARTPVAAPAPGPVGARSGVAASRVLPLRVPNPRAYVASKAALERAYARRLRSQANAGRGAQSSATINSQPLALSSSGTALAPATSTALFEGLNQPGLSSGGPYTSATPPDATGAIGPGYYVEFVNSQIAVYDRTTMTQVASESENAFTAGADTCDAQIRWDEQAQRWEYASLDCGLTGSEQLNFGWSKTADPSELSKGWCRYHEATGKVLEDYPKLGGDDQFLFIGTNGFEITPEKEEYRGSYVFAIPKPPAGEFTCPLESNVAAGIHKIPMPLSVFTPVPANVYGGSSTGYVVAAEYPELGPGSKLRLFTLSGSGATLSGPVEISVSKYYLPPAVPQPNTSNGIDSMDARLTQAVAVEDPTLHKLAIWTQHTISIAEGAPSVVRWYELQPGAFKPVQEGTVQAPGGNFAFNGAISPTSAGDGAAVDYNIGGSGLLVQLWGQSRVAATTAGTMTGAVKLAESQAIDDDFSCPSAKTQASGPTCRWGDYAGASPDPSHPSVVWGSGQFDGPMRAENAAQWATENFALVADTPPTASFTVTTSSPTAAWPVAFDGSASGDPDGTIASYAWSFGDGATETGASASKPSHTYAKAGTYNVKVTVTDNAGLTASVEHSITVADAPPSASFNVTTSSPTAASPVAFDGSASSDPDGTIASYAWSFGDSSSGTGATPSHTYAKASTYTVKLTVTDNAGLTASAEHEVTVADAPPSAAFKVTTPSPTAASPVAFDGSASSDPDGTVSSYSWNFGDGGSATVASPSHTYTKAGTYAVKLTVTDNAGLSASVEHDVTVADVPPVASFTVITSFPTAGGSVAFDGMASSDVDGTITNWSWSFGDGGSGTGAIPTHTYASAGTYTVTLTVTDDAGLTAHVEQQVIVAEPSKPLPGPEGKEGKEGAQGLTGPLGPVGPQGPEGKQGSEGKEGKQGPQGAPGEIELVTCKLVVRKVKGKRKTTRQCTTTLVSGTVTFTATISARARLSRAGVLYATGSLRRGRLVLHARRPVRPGRYTLALRRREGRVWVTTRQRILLGRSS